jgi:hypothetical protein
MTPPISFDDIFAKLGLAGISDEEKEKMTKDMEEIIESRITIAIMEKLSDEEKAAMEKLNTDEEMADFFKSHGIDPAAIAMEEAVRFREEMIADGSFIQAQVEAKMKDEQSSADAQ